jgi:hypothetical protein
VKALIALSIALAALTAAVALVLAHPGHFSCGVLEPTPLGTTCAPGTEHHSSRPTWVWFAGAAIVFSGVAAGAAVWRRT